ncbi:hypothetical protein EB796_017024 [Bugula neritina]|uniref:Uncharacterized protein n=1 Tax=Bugula neritina TaxID=10212 RepID=A0A7J7JEC4_BUGNE|nr:hypothetical protein EB796_017024 [Bugula neritina]
MIKGNNWGQEYVDGELVSGLGYGSQEEFINCADLKIISSGAEITNLNQSTTLKPTTDKIQTAGKSTLSAILSTTAKKTRCYDKKSEFNAWCTNNCALGNCNPDYCWCDDNPVLPTKKVCEGVHKVWCENNCNHIPSYCPASHCTCQDVQFDPRV